ncbi:hypothetical protein N7532_005678 [Penicillium argentinense]|uniref:Uncharacterized protein n=1 Tax=Penicillium argentinense TaxID=1131581 RepID=A0A9W9FEW6_9EURO|nr:uncharacterized protein N7532_005678 [Penicillium argentinense]KAJ5098677.1 hypothetical protein N7532_005678 [Penicillium argentinense]
MTTFHLENDNAVGGQEKFVASGLPTPSTQVSPQIRGSVPVDTANETQATPNPTASEPMLSAVVYEGYQFFKADPTTGQKATWNRVERTQMHLSQGEFYKMVQKRANKVSAVQQYQNLSDTRRAHVNQLIHEQRRNDPSVEWSCVYAKERDRPSKARNAHRDDYETVSMDIILMKRPIKTKSYPRTPMGDLVELDMPFRNDHNSTSAMMMPPGNPATKPFMPGQVIGPGYVVQGPLPRPVSVTSPFTRLDLGHPAAEDQFIGMGGHTALEKNMEHDAGWSSEEVDSEDDDESMIFDQSPSRMSSETAHPDNMDSNTTTICTIHSAATLV